MAVSSPSAAYDELTEIKKKQAEERAKQAEQRTKDADQYNIYTARGPRDSWMPSELTNARAFWMRMLGLGVTDPMCKRLVRIAAEEIYIIEGFMSRWFRMPEMLTDSEYQGEYRAIMSRFRYTQGMLGDLTNVDTSEMEAVNA